MALLEVHQRPSPALRQPQAHPLSSAGVQSKDPVLSKGADEKSETER